MRLTQIDGLRAVAALAVLAYHFTTRFDELFPGGAAIAGGLRWGHLGVNLFFAISGFVILMTVDRCRDTGEFVASRFARLFPAFWASIIATWLVVALWRAPGTNPSGGETLLNFTMLPMLFGAQRVDGVYWSLQVELFYYAWMLLLWRGGLLANTCRLLAAWLLLAIAAELARKAYGFELLPLSRELLLLDWIPWFALGMTAYLTRRDASFMPRHAVVVALALIAIGLTGTPSTFAFAGITLAVVLAAAHARLPLLDWRPLVWLGAISYPLYLLHQQIGYTIMLQAGISTAGQRCVATLLAAGTAVLLAALMHRYVEEPARIALRRRLRAPAGTPASPGASSA